METVDASLSGCGAFGNSSQCVPEMLSEGNSGGGGGGDGRFPLVSLMLPRILCRLSLRCSPRRQERPFFGHVLFLSFITVANQKLARLQCLLKSFLSGRVQEVEVQCQK